MAQSVLHKADTRGVADHGWLKSSHSFSFAGYYNPERMNFGALRVLNDDTVSGGMGFGEHPHDNMEIISLPLSGKLQHKDSLSNIATISAGEIQVMSAGTGVYHAEYNANPDEIVKFLQIWIFPNKKNVVPRYDQQLIDTTSQNKLIQILSPDKNDDGVWIHQQAWFNMGRFNAGNSDHYNLHSEGNGVYVFVLNGSIAVNDHVLDTRDGYGIWETETIALKATTDCEFLLIEVPMVF